MAEINAPATLTTPGGVIQFNELNVSAYYFFQNVDGLDQAPLRAEIEERPHAPGAIVHPFIDDARHITLDGFVVAVTVEGRNLMENALILACESIRDADGTYSWTPAGLGEHSLTVRCDINVKFSGNHGPIVKDFAFGLVAANPTISR